MSIVRSVFGRPPEAIQMAPVIRGLQRLNIVVTFAPLPSASLPSTALGTGGTGRAGVGIPCVTLLADVPGFHVSRDRHPTPLPYDYAPLDKLGTGRTGSPPLVGRSRAWTAVSRYWPRPS